MKKLNQYIKESILDDEDDLVNNNILYKPKNKDELIRNIKTCLDGKIYDLNCIDTSNIIGMDDLFNVEYGPLRKYENDIKKIDISQWNVSRVVSMHGMFMYSDFNGDISEWDTSRLVYSGEMFYKSSFNGDISKWDMSKNRDRQDMFLGCPLEKHPPRWYKK